VPAALVCPIRKVHLFTPLASFVSRLALLFPIFEIYLIPLPEHVITYKRLIAQHELGRLASLVTADLGCQASRPSFHNSTGDLQHAPEGLTAFAFTGPWIGVETRRTADGSPAGSIGSWT
jgi:hypothetical protein